MASVGNCTITAPTGPGDAVTSQLFNGVRTLTVDYPADRLLLVLGNGKLHDFDLNTIATITWTVSGNTHTVDFTT